MSTAKAGESGASTPAKPLQYNQLISHYRFSDGDVLGEGAYGAVFRAYDTSIKAADSASTATTSSTAAAAAANLPAELRGCRVVALKQMTSATSEDGLAAATLREIGILKELSQVLRSDQRGDSLARLGGCATFASGLTEKALQPPSATAAAAAARAATFGGVPAGPRQRGGSTGATTTSTSTTAATTAVLSSNTTELSVTEPGHNGDATAEDYGGLPFSPWLTVSPATRLRALTGCLTERELEALVAEGRNHVLDLYDVAIDRASSKVFVALEFCEGGDAWHYLRSVPDRRVKDARVFRRWVSEMMLGVAFMHGKHLSHRDLKPQNIMLKRRTPVITQTTSAADNKEATAAGEEFTLKVADFGLSRIENIPVKKYVHEAVTLWYRSPDIILGNVNYTYSVDAWSLGCIIVEMASGTAPFRGKDESDQLKRIFARLGGPLPKELPSFMNYPHSATFAPLLQSMVQYHQKEPDGKLLAAKEEEELAALLAVEKHTPQAAQTPLALLQHIAANKARLRVLMENRGGGMDVLGDDGLDLVARLLIVDPVKRLSVIEAMQHPFLRASFFDEDGVLSIGGGLGAGREECGAATAAASSLAPPPHGGAGPAYRRSQIVATGHKGREAWISASVRCTDAQPPPPSAAGQTASANPNATSAVLTSGGAAAAKAGNAVSHPVLRQVGGNSNISSNNGTGGAGVLLPALGAAAAAKAPAGTVPRVSGRLATTTSTTTGAVSSPRGGGGGSASIRGGQSRSKGSHSAFTSNNASNANRSKNTNGVGKSFQNAGEAELSGRRGSSAAPSQQHPQQSGSGNSTAANNKDSTNASGNARRRESSVGGSL